jgi:hypothetical protein
MNHDMIVAAKDNDIPDDRIAPAFHNDLLPRHDRRQHARSSEGGRELPPLALPEFRNGLKFCGRRRLECESDLVHDWATKEWAV